jgi:hypothetical protein
MRTLGHSLTLTRLAAGLALLLAVLVAPAAQADSVAPASAEPGSIMLPELSGLISGRQSIATPIVIPVAGTLTITLSDLAWPEALQSLSFSLTDTHSVLAQLVSPGVLTVDISTPGQYFGFVYGAAQGALNLGLYSVSLSLTPSVPQVPVPAAAWLLLSGCGALFSFRRRRVP